MLAANVGEARTLRSEHPFLPAGGHDIDLQLLHIDGKHAQALNRVNDAERAVRVCDFGDAGKIMSISGGVTDKTDGDHASASVARFGEFVEIDEPTDFGRH